MKAIGIFIAGALFGIALIGAGGWLWMRHAIKFVAEQEQSSVPDTARELSKAKAKLDSATNEYERWVALGDFGFWSVDAGEFDTAQRSAEELLAHAEKCKSDWNYGNAMHKGNLILGRLELKKGNREKAKAYLIAAGKTPGSPQLDSFGPNMMLAKELLEAGEKDAVLEYFSLCGVFWKHDFGMLSVWKDVVHEGRIPNFAANLVY